MTDPVNQKYVSELVPDYTSPEIIIKNPRNFTIYGDTKSFYKSVILELEQKRKKWIDEYKTDIKKIGDNIGVDFKDEITIARLEKDIQKIRHMRYCVKLCENIQVGLPEESLTMLIEDDDGYSAGFLYIHGYREKTLK